MFDIGLSEILVIGVVALLVIGPERLPEVARTAGKYFGKFRAVVSGVQRDFNAELQNTELKKLISDQESQLNQLRTIVTETRAELNKSANDVGNAVDDAIKESNKS